MLSIYNFLKVKLCYRTYWKQWLAFLTMCFLVFACGSDDKKNDLEETNLNGKVKSVKETMYSAVEKFGEPVKDEFITQYVYYFNKDGFIKETDVFNESDELKERWKRKYDDDGNLIESNMYNSDGELEEKRKGKYDDGNIIEAYIYDKYGELKEKWKHEYDNDGNKIESSIYDKDGELKERWKYKYYDDGNQTESNNYNEGEELKGSWVSKKDDDGNLIELNYYEDGELMFKTEYEYKEFDNKNWLIRIGYEEEKATEIIEREIEYYN